jgi:DNA-binding response OmpR family regulator
MKLLIAEDDALFRRLLQQTLAPYHEVITTQDGNEAWAALQQVDAPQLAILDWVMPGMSGPEVCRRVRQCARLDSMYLIILTAKNTLADVVSGLRAGADDYVTKPFSPEELRARVNIGKRILDLKASLAERSAEANESSARETQLQQLLLSLPCRQGSESNQENWPGVEAYLRQSSEARDINCDGCRLLPDRPNLQPASSNPWTIPHE